MEGDPGMRKRFPALLAACGGVLMMTALMAAPVAAQKAAPPARPIRYVIIVSVDGLLPASYMDPDAHVLKVPTLLELAKNGAASAGALSVIPASTYIAHTSIATGTNPGTHGIVSTQ